MLIQDILTHFEGVKACGNNQYTATCPYCGKQKHLYISDMTDKTVLHCMKGCSFEEVVLAAGLKKSDFFNAPKKQDFFNTPKKQAWKFLREHIYSDRAGQPVAKKQIYDKGDGKTAVWYHWENNAYIKGLNGMKPPLYHLQNVIACTDRIFIAEGEKDVETLERMGFTATTSPNGAGSKWSKSYNSYLQGLDVIILSDNDQAGELHALDIAESLSDDVRSVKIIPAKAIYAEVKPKGDISDIVEVVGIDRAKELLLEAVADSEPFEPQKAVTQVVQPDVMLAGTGNKELPPYILEHMNEKSGEVRYSVSCPLLADYIRKNSRYIFTRGKASEQVNRFLYSDGVYKLISDDEFKGLIKNYITAYDETLLKMRDIKEVFQNLTTDLNFVDSSELNADENLVNFQNGLLDMKTMKLLPHSPDIFSTIQIPCNWNNSAGNSPIFDSFINRFTDADKTKQRFLLQYMGVALSNIKGYRMKKALFMVGEGNTGKSQLKGLTERLLGSANYTNIELSQLEDRFGSCNLFNKRLAGSSDMGFIAVRELKVFKQITGGDNIFMEDKGKSGFSGRFNGVLWFGMNELPKFGGDRGEWVYNRIIPFLCSNVIPEHEQDGEILDKMFKERESIVTKAIQGAKQVIDNGYKYDIPECCQAVKDDYKVENSPTLQFYYGCCQPRMGAIKDNCTCSRLYKVFQAWCKDNSRGFCPSVREFRKELAELLADGDIKQLEMLKDGFRYYIFTIKLEVKKDYGEQYGYDNVS